MAALATGDRPEQPLSNGWLHPTEQGGAPAKRVPHAAEIKATEDAILAKAKAIKLLKQQQGGEVVVQEAVPEPPRVYSHWDYVAFEAQWLHKDMAQEKLWKKKAAFYFANLIASSTIRLRPVKHEDRKDEDEEGEHTNAGRRASSRPVKGGSSSRAKRPSKTKRTTSLKSEGDEENEGLHKDDDNACRAHDAANCRPHPPPAAVLTYNFNRKWPQSVREVILRKNDEIVISKLIQWQEYEHEYEANRMAVEDHWRELAAKRAQEREAKGLVDVDRRRFDVYDIGHDGGVSMTSASLLDENGDFPDNATTSQPVGSRRPPKRHRPVHQDEPFQPRPGKRNNNAAPVAPARQPLGQSWDSEDDRLLCSIMSEFGENSALVADVYVSTRRLEGIHCDAAHAEHRIRQMVEQAQLRGQAQDGGALTPDFPMPKLEAREFLQQSIPCMASVVMRYQAAIQPIAEQVVRERDMEEKSVGQKKAEYMLHNRISKHPTHQRFITDAHAKFNGVSFPKQMLEMMRAQADPNRARVPSQFAAQQMPPNAQPMPLNAGQQQQQLPPQQQQQAHGVDQSAVAAYRAMQASGSDGVPPQQHLTPQQLQALQAQQHQRAAQYAAQGGPGMPGMATAGGMPPNGSLPHQGRGPGGASLMPPQYQQMARPQMPGQRPSSGNAPGLPGYVMPGLAHHGMRPMQPGVNDAQLNAGNAMPPQYQLLPGGPGQAHAPQVMQVAMQHMQDAAGLARHSHNNGLPPAMQGGARVPHNLPPAPS